MELEQLEALALAPDRATGMATLLPGTPEHDYWSGIALQHTGRLDEVDAILAAWTKRHGASEMFERLKRRQLVLRAGADLPSHADALRRAAGVRLDDRAEVVAQAERFPTQLDQALVAGRSLVDHERAHRPDLSTLTDGALPELVLRGAELSAASRRALLQRLSRANVPGLVGLIVQDLDEKSSSGFGSLPIHALLTLAQLDELATLRPALRAFPTWVDAVLTRLQPGTVSDDPADAERERSELLDRVWRFAVTLTPAFNGLKAIVLYHQLAQGRSNGIYDRARFDEYLRLPRHAAYVSREWMERTDEKLLVRPGANDAWAAGLEPIADDEALVREYLAHFLLEEDGTAFADRVKADWLEQQLATTRLLAGAPNPSRWAALLGPARLAALNERVDIELTARNRPRFTATERVTLEVDVKNVRALEVKVFRINTVAYFLTRNGAEVDTSLDLDGMIAQDERVLHLDVPPMQRTRQHLDLPGCDRPGTYIVELIGNGRSSRALLRKGTLRHDTRIGAAGIVVSVFDEDGSLVKEARLWLAGRELTSREDGGISIPFSTRPGATPVLLVHGELTARVTIDLPSEVLALTAGFHVERESLVPNRSARILCRPTLTIGGTRASLALLEEPHLDLWVTLLDGTLTILNRSIALEDDAEATVDIQIPDGAVRIEMGIGGTLRVQSTQRTTPLFSARVVAPFNQIHATPQTEAAHLATTAGPEHTLFLLGKTGEPLRGRALPLTFRHEAVNALVTLTLETDTRGAIALGALEGITHVGVRLPSGTEQQWALEPIFESPRLVHAAAGTPVLLPAPPGVRPGAPEDLVLVELRGGAPAYDRSAAVTLDARALVITGLGPGTYRLSCRGALDVAIVIAAPGDASLELSPEIPLLREARADEGVLFLRTSGTSDAARVHVMGLRFLPTNALPSTLHRPPAWPRTSRRSAHVSHYISGRDIGDEYRYVLQRRSARPRLGTMLDKPGLLLNPWAIRTTSTAVQAAAPGFAYPASPAAAGAPPAMAGARGYGGPGGAAAGVIEGFPTLDFLASSAIVLDNLRPDQDGVIRVPLADLGAAQTVRIVLVDPALTSTLDVMLPARAAPARDLRLRLALDPAGHFVEDRRAAAAPAGVPIVIEDVRTGKVELIATLDRARTLLLTLGAGDMLEELGFLTAWSSLDDTTKRARYSKLACHEVHLFLWRKDPAFFAAVIRPYLAHKRHPTFVDRFLLGHDLSAYVEPWRFGRLNAVERILLGMAIPAVRDAVARLTGDEVDLLPRDAARDAHLLSTLLGAGALEAPLAAGAMEPEAFMDESQDSFGAAGAAPPAAMKKAMRVRSSSARGGGGGQQLAADLAERERGVVLYRGVDRTEEWAETGWWKRRIADSGPELVPPNRFWRDLARHDGKGPFLSPHLADCTMNGTVALCALAFLDLPFVEETPESVLDDTHLTLTPRSHALAARSRIAPIAAPVIRSAVLIGQTYFRADDRYEWDGTENREKPVMGELIVGVVYTCHVVVTNPTASRQRLSVLLQIPRGSIPVDSGFFTRTRELDLEPYGTQSVEYGFYFPTAGTWSHFPAHVTRDAELLAFVEPRELEVVDTPSTVDHTSWAYVSQHGTLEDVLGFLDRTNLGRIDLDRIAWRMHEPSAFGRVTATLAARHVYHDGLWKYALAHHDRTRAAEWLRNQETFVRGAGPALHSDLALTQLDPLERGWYEHLEYAPLVNARAHQLGQKQRILNDGLASQYRSFLDVVAHRPRATPDDLLAAVHYLLTMDRVDDAVALLSRIDPALVSGPMQVAYVTAYVASLQGDLPAARRLATPWLEHPVDRWRHRFAALVAMLDEAEGGVKAAVVDREDRAQHLGAAAAREPGLELSADRSVITLQHQALSRCQVRFYPMNVELLFSRQPFVQGDVERFSWIEPRLVVDVSLTNDGRTVVPIPPALGNANLVVEVVGDGVRRALAHYAHDLGVQVAQAFGQVLVTRASTHAALPATYVKVYARQRNGQVAFYKDGYTDPRGRFDYATLSTDDLDRVERFALLVASTDAGATILETSPPAR